MSADVLRIPLPADLSADERRRIVEDGRAYADVLSAAYLADGADFDRTRGAVAECAITYADDFRALAESLPFDSLGRRRLELLVYMVDEATGADR